IREPDRLVQIARSYDDAPRWDNWSWPAAHLIEEEGRVFSGVAGFSNAAFVLGRGEDAEAVPGQYVSAGFFSVLGVRPVLGRLLDASDEVAPGSHPVVVLSHGLWVRRFGSDPGVAGTAVSLGSTPYEIVGVAPPDFAGVDALGYTPDLWVPAYQRVDFRGRTPFDQWGSSWFYLFGRLQDGVTFAAAEAAMDPVSMSLRAASEENRQIRVLLAPGVGLSPDERADGRRVGWLLTGIATLVLLLTCANVGNLFLARATERIEEVGIRQALGAGRTRLVRQLVTESVALALVATALAVPLVVVVGGLLPSLLPWRLAVSLAPDARVFAFMAVVGVVAGLLFGALPSLAVSRRDVARTLREGGTTGGRQRTRLRDALVVGQLALSLGLVSGAALLGRSVLNARTADPGFDADHVLVGFLNLSATGRYGNDDIADFDERLVAQLQATPGIAAAAVGGQAPILGGHSRSTVAPADRLDDENARFEAEYTVVTPDYFSTLGIPVLRGRTFREAAQEAEPVVVVNDALARLFWPGEDAVGKELAAEGRTLRIIGVVGDVQMRSLRATANPGAYYPYHQFPEAYLAVHVRTLGPTGAAVPALKRAVAAVDPELPLTGITDLRQGIVRSLAETRAFVSIVGSFAGLALVLAVIGLYGLVAHGVSSRAREMGIRVALGAGSGELHRLILSRAVLLAGVGVVLGLGVAMALGQALEGILFGVSAASPAVLGGAAVVLLGASLVAAWIPARRAGRVDAAVSLRE
ncbi:MAG TPA: ABC transporter permease, partial [Longimicrobiales bacterium]|nr:ABC transporter permease [Longimicrobiales bacterium]